MRLKHVVLLLSLAACTANVLAAEGNDAADLTYSLSRPADTLRVVPLKTAVRLEIHSASGIGKLKITRGIDAWPKRLVLSIDLKSLEGLDLTTDRLRLHTSLGGQTVEVSQLDPGGKWLVLLDTHGYATSIRNAAGRIEIEFPAKVLSEDLKTFEVQWIDAYR